MPFTCLPYSWPWSGIDVHISMERMVVNAWIGTLESVKLPILLQCSIIVGLFRKEKSSVVYIEDLGPFCLLFCFRTKCHLCIHLGHVWFALGVRTIRVTLYLAYFEVFGYHSPSTVWIQVGGLWIKIQQPCASIWIIIFCDWNIAPVKFVLAKVLANIICWGFWNCLICLYSR